MQEISVSMRFGTTLAGEMKAEERRLAIGRSSGGFAPYELLLGALGSCYYATFIGIAQKMRLEYEGVDIAINGVKRDEIPTTLRTVDMVVTVRGAKSEKGFERASELAAKHCSVHATISQVAQIRLTLGFEVA